MAFIVEIFVQPDQGCSWGFNPFVEIDSPVSS
jgi:hypothetical protein